MQKCKFGSTHGKKETTNVELAIFPGKRIFDVALVARGLIFTNHRSSSEPIFHAAARERLIYFAFSGNARERCAPKVDGVSIAAARRGVPQFIMQN